MSIATFAKFYRRTGGLPKVWTREELKDIAGSGFPGDSSQPQLNLD